MSPDRIAVVDVETTGLSPWRNDRLVEIAIVVIARDGRVYEEYETLVNPLRDIGPTSIHGITASDVLHAPVFADVAGDVLRLLAGAALIAGHNVSFDKNFLVCEYQRIGIPLPDLSLLCTCRLFGRSSLKACCDEVGIAVDGMPHRALADARATAQLVTHVCGEDSTLLDQHRIRDVRWPQITARQTPCYPREHATAMQAEPHRFLQRIASRVRRDVEATPPDILAYMALVDRVLEDRAIDEAEESALVDAASSWQLSRAQVDAAHAQYLHSLAVAALTDGIVSEGERRDLHLVARLLGQDKEALDAMLASAAKQLAAVVTPPSSGSGENDRHGQRVCFTGELQSTLRGQPITREMAEALATRAGLTVVGSVTKKLDLLVVADPNTQSSKAKKARSYNVRILSDTVFWRMTDITID